MITANSLSLFPREPAFVHDYARKPYREVRDDEPCRIGIMISANNINGSVLVDDQVGSAGVMFLVVLGLLLYEVDVIIALLALKAIYACFDGRRKKRRGGIIRLVSF